MWLTLILRYWYIAVIASLSLALTLSMSHGRLLTAELKAVQNSLSEYKATQAAMASSTKVTSDRVIEEIKHDYKIQTAAIKATAFANAKARFGTCNSVLSRLPARDTLRDGQAGSAGSADDAHQQEPVVVGADFIESCARDANVTELWKRWATGNQLITSKE